MDNAEQAAQDAQGLTDTYHEAISNSQDVNQAHVNGLKAVWDRAVAETHKFRDEAGSLVSGEDIAALKARIAELEAQVTPKV